MEERGRGRTPTGTIAILFHRVQNETEGYTNKVVSALTHKQVVFAVEDGKGVSLASES